MKQFFSLTSRERNGLFVMLIFLLAYVGYLKFMQVKYEPDVTDLSLLTDSVEQFYNASAEVEELALEMAVSVPSVKIAVVADEKPKQSIEQIVIVDINRASRDELRKVVGIGDYFSRMIVQMRKQIGGYYNTKQLLEIPGLTEEQYKAILPQISLDTTLSAPKIDINIADAKSFDGVYGVDEYCANSIVRYREKLGGFYTIEQLREVPAITEQLYKELEGRTYVQDPHLIQIRINTASFDEVMRHPYIATFESTKAIFRYLDFGPISSWDDFIQIPNLHLDKLNELEPYLDFSTTEVQQG